MALGLVKALVQQTNNTLDSQTLRPIYMGRYNISMLLTKRAELWQVNIETEQAKGDTPAHAKCF